MKVLVTGATGHVGSNLIRRLLQDGHEVRAFLRRDAQLEGLLGLDVERVEGDVRDAQSVIRAMKGQEAVFHTAALISLRNIDRDALMSTNVQGTANVMEAALAEKVDRVVHTSSFGAIGGQAGIKATESDDLDPFEAVMDYERSKAASEIPVMRAALRGLNVCIVNPSAIVGPHDYRPSNVGRMILDVAKGQMKIYVPGAFDWVPMQDVVQGHVLALEKGAPGQRYLLSGEEHSVDQILDWISEFSGCSRPRISLNPALMHSVAVVKDWIQERTFPKATPRFNQHSIRILNSGKSGDNSKARKELGLKPTSSKKAFQDAVMWFQASGRLTKSHMLDASSTS